MSKKQKTAQEDDYKLVYWPLPGRGEFIRIVFEEAGQAFSDVSQQKSCIKEVTSFNEGRHDSLKNGCPFAPPILVHGDLVLSQTPAILYYLGPRLGLAPESEKDRLRIHAIVLTILDGLSNEAHDVHHPISVGQYYEEQKDPALARAKDYKSNRLPKFLNWLDRLLSTDGENDYLFANSLTYADLVLFQAIDGLHFAFPQSMKGLMQKHDKVQRHYNRIKARPRISAYLASARRLPYSNGIYRYYKELDEA